ncbi:MAG: alpha-galactosidase, partial [Prevotella sp.]|nr:alpha-galactosidase [Prevotella sp.]
MRRKIIGALTLLASMPLLAWQGEVVVETPNSQLLLSAQGGQDLRQSYYGNKSATLAQLRDAGADLAFHALPAFGTVDAVHTPALMVQHNDGDLNLELTVTDYAVQDEARYTLHIFTMQDKLLPFTVKVFYKAYKQVDIIETWTEMVHQERRAITLKRFDSGHLTLRQGDVWITHLHGNWAAETEPTTEALTLGMKTIRNTDGARNAHLDAPEMMLSLDGRPQELTGRTIGIALCWSGNYELRVNTISRREHHVYAGIDPNASEYILEPREVFETPHLAMAYSDEGMSGVSRAFHRWARTEGMLHRGMNTGDILLNSWEGIYFDINEERITRMMDDIASFGGELFVMDDGWFGQKYPRNNDSSSLGDWQADTNKLPQGIGALTAAARQRGIKFGIWIEPEMTNTVSELYERHPDWVLQRQGRELRQGRGGTQVV